MVNPCNAPRQHLERNKLMGQLKMLNFCTVKDNVKRIRKQATNWEKMFIKCMFDPGLLSKIYEVLKLNNKNNLPDYRMGQGPEQIPH